MTDASLINRLNRQLNRETSAMLRYVLEAAALSGERHITARSLYLMEVRDKVECAQYLADQIVALGGNPTLSPEVIRPQLTLREMLRHDAAEERAGEQNYRDLATEAERARLWSLKRKLNDQAATEHQHVAEMESLLW